MANESAVVETARATADVAETIAENAEAAQTAAAVSDAIDAAEDAIERAEETAEELAAAAMESERGRRIEALEQEFTTWRGNQETAMAELRSALQAAQTQIQELTQTVALLQATPAPVAVAVVPAEPSTPTVPATPAVVAAEVVAPDASPVPIAAASAVPVRRKARFL